MFWKRNSAVVDPQEPEKTLRIVAALFTLDGVLSIVSMVAKAVMGNLNLSTGILSFWIAAGLRRKDPKWLSWAKGFIWFDLIALDLVTLIMTLNDSQPVARWGFYNGTIPKTPVIVYCALQGALSLWKLSVLRRSSVDALFVEKDVKAIPDSQNAAPTTIGEPATWPAPLQEAEQKQRLRRELR